MHHVGINVFCIGETKGNTEGQRKWLDHIGAENYEISTDLTGPESVIGHAAKRCYMSFEPGLNPNVSKVRKDWSQYFENILKSGHGSVLEHGTYTYAIEGVSRVFSGEMNRHRAGVAISEGSMRYIRFEDVPFWMPPSIRLTAEEQAYYDKFEGTDYFMTKDAELASLVKKKITSQLVFDDMFRMAEEAYRELGEVWGIDDPDTPMLFSQKKILTSMFRRIMPMGVATGGVWTFNLRALRHILALRTSPHAEEEIAYAVSLIAKDIISREPRLFCDFEETEAGWVPKYEKV